MFAPLVGRDQDGDEVFGAPKVVGCITPLERNEQRAGLLECKHIPRDTGFYFVFQRKELDTFEIPPKKPEHDRER